MLAESLRFVAQGPVDPDCARPVPIPASSAALPLVPSFRSIYDEHFDFVWRFAAHRGVAQSALDDVAQEVFVVVARRLGSFEGRSALRTWMAGIARHVIRGYLRKRGNAPAGEPLLDEELYASPLPTPAEALEAKSATELLDVILSHLTGLQRETFVLCELEGLSAMEVAEAVGSNEHTVRTRLHDARKVFEAVSSRLAARAAFDARARGEKR